MTIIELAPHVTGKMADEIIKAVREKADPDAYLGITYTIITTYPIAAHRVILEIEKEKP